MENMEKAIQDVLVKLNNIEDSNGKIKKKTGPCTESVTSNEKCK